MTTYAASEVRALLARGPSEGENFYRLKATGNGETNWVNVSSKELAAIARVVDDAVIDRDQLSEAIRNADAIAEEHENLPAYWRSHNVDIEGLIYVAMQRGLRAVMIEKGVSPNLQRPTVVSLTREEEIRQMRYAASFMDGFATAFESLGH